MVRFRFRSFVYMPNGWLGRTLDAKKGGSSLRTAENKNSGKDAPMFWQEVNKLISVNGLIKRSQFVRSYYFSLHWPPPPSFTQKVRNPSVLSPYNLFNYISFPMDYDDWLPILYCSHHHPHQRACNACLSFFPSLRISDINSRLQIPGKTSQVARVCDGRWYTSCPMHVHPPIQSVPIEAK